MRVSITRRLLAVTAAVAAAAAGGGLLIAGGITASANTGTVIATESCSSWAVTVSLDNNVVESDTVDVLTTIPGTTGLFGKHYDTTHASGLTEIWSAGAAVPPAVSGTVTLDIYSEGNSRTPEFTTSASIAPAEGCSTPTPCPTYSPRDDAVVLTVAEQTACATPTATATPSAPPNRLAVTTTCGGAVDITGGIPGYVFTAYGPGVPWALAGKVTITSNDDAMLVLPPGTYQYSYGSSTLIGSFYIGACPTAPPTPTATSTPTPQPTPPIVTAPPACTDCGRG
jgi:hypothetical protein